MKANEYFITNGLPFTYGQRVFVRDDVGSQVKNILAKASVWGGHDKTWELSDDVRAIGFEFPSDPEKAKTVLTQLKETMASIGMVCIKPYSLQSRRNPKGFRLFCFTY